MSSVRKGDGRERGRRRRHRRHGRRARRGAAGRGRELRGWRRWQRQMQQRQRHDLRPVHAEDYRGDPGDLLHDLRRLRLSGGEPEHGGHGDVPGHLRRVGAGGDGPRLLRRPHLRRALQPRRHRRLRHVWALPLEAGAVVCCGPGAGIDAGQPDAARGVRRRHGARALLRDGAVGVGRAGGGARVRHLLLPHVRRLRRRHRQQSGNHRHHRRSVRLSSFDGADALAIVLAQIGELAGLAVGATVLLNVLFAGWGFSAWPTGPLRARP
ncbi:uncharacterized protein LOC112894072 isoform X3 [Panicum hallii]|uniref:uncharacterized protein LOC112894072 isoform X3 n=1 Tax=Panicum hallii TaxID=206008 RepID=UPI000DF4CB99|nr:uncharacterized protein LOC112894072 isoform X3 [Panicum hallii]